MARKTSPNLTETELRLMEVIWSRGRSTVAEVAEAIGQSAYTTVLTMLRVLEKKGYLRHQKKGRAFVYEAVVGRGEASEKAVNYLVSRFFNNSPELLMLNILEKRKMDPEEIKRLKKLIEES